MNWLIWDEKQQIHFPFSPDLFEHLSGVSLVCWKNRINEKVRYKEVLEMIS